MREYKLEVSDRNGKILYDFQFQSTEVELKKFLQLMNSGFVVSPPSLGLSISDVVTQQEIDQAVVKHG